MAETTKTFNYKARSIVGNKFYEGKTKAQSESAVREFLVSRNLIPLDVSEQGALQKDISFGKKNVKPRDVSTFMRQFATMINAGIPIKRALETMRDQQSNPTFQAALSKITQDIDTGLTFADAIAKHPTIFAPLTIAMVRAGEAGGFLANVLEQVAENLEKDIQLRNKIKSAMTYPVVVFILAILIVTIMLLFIVPVFANLFNSLGGNLPIPTQILVFLSDGMKVGIWFIVPAVIFGSIWWRKNKHKLFVREFIDPIIIKIPVFGKLARLLAVSRFARNFGSLLDSGLPVLQVLDIAGSTSGNIVIERALVEVRQAVSTGELIAPQLKKHAIFPSMLVAMLAVGEDAGEIPQMMSKVADFYENETETMTDQLSALIEPLMLVFLGVLVGGIVVSLYLPMFSIYELINK